LELDLVYSKTPLVADEIWLVIDASRLAQNPLRGKRNFSERYCVSDVGGGTCVDMRRSLWLGIRDDKEEEMPKYLFQASYTVQGEEGVRAKGGSDRRDAIAETMHSVGGQLESLYFEFGERDAFAIVELPDNEAAAAVSLIENAAGTATVKTTVLLTPEQVDEAANRAVSYRPPGL
jgi:uncharacterized protein with GYD domain